LAGGSVFVEPYSHFWAHNVVWKNCATWNSGGAVWAPETAFAHMFSCSFVNNSAYAGPAPHCSCGAPPVCCTGGAISTGPWDQADVCCENCVFSGNHLKDIEGGVTKLGPRAGDD
jgi:hypothetical protein